MLTQTAIFRMYLKTVFLFSAFGRIPSTQFLRTLFGRNRTGLSQWLTLTIGNLIGPLFGGFGDLFDFFFPDFPSFSDLYDAFIDWIQSRDPVSPKTG